MPGLIRAASSGEKPSAASALRPIALRENIRLRQQVAQRAPPLLALEIDKARQLAAAGIDGEPGDRRQIGAGNQQHVGAMRGQRAARDRTGDHPRQIQHAQARQADGRRRATVLARPRRFSRSRSAAIRPAPWHAAAPTIRRTSASSRRRRRRHRPRSRTPRHPIASARPAPRRAPACSSEPCRRRRGDAENWCAAARSAGRAVL